MNDATAGRPLRLLHVTTVAQTLQFLTGHMAYARSRGVEVHALSSPGPQLTDVGADGAVQIHVLPMARRITPLADLMSLWRLRRVLRQIRPDIVHAHTPKGGLLAMIAAWLCRVPVRIYHLHGLPLQTATGFRRLLLRWSEKVSCRLAHQVLCVSPSLCELALAEKLCAPERIKVLRKGHIDGVDAERDFNPDVIGPTVRQDVRRQHGIPFDAPVLGFVGRIVRDKGLIELTQAWQALRDVFPSLHLLAVGPFEPQDPVPAEVESILRNDPRIHLAGDILDKRGMPPFYAAMDLLVLPTYREGFPTVLLEAAAMELPMVATRVPGCVDAICEGETGAIVPSHDAGALAQALRAYLTDADLRRQHGLAGRKRVLRDFRPEAMSEALYQEYDRLLCGASFQLAQRQGQVENLPHKLPLTGKPGSRYRRYGKRLCDILLSAVACVLLAPALLVLAIVVRCFLGAPILFRQERSGLGGRTFTILKFRSMTNERDASGEMLSDSQRLTRLGRFLRRTSLDELPELWNVLRGDMSLVGPRPLLPRYDAFYSDVEKRRFELLPGITGWAQINGRNDLAWDDRFRCDIWYVDACSFWLDVRILLRTVVKVIRRDNVQVDSGLTFGALDEERRNSMRVLAKD